MEETSRIFPAGNNSAENAAAGPPRDACNYAVIKVTDYRSRSCEFAGREPVIAIPLTRPRKNPVDNGPRASPGDLNFARTIVQTGSSR